MQDFSDGVPIVNVTIKQVRKINSEKEMWFCKYKECDKYFGDVFDSDSE